MLVFESEGAIDTWSERHAIPRGSAQPIQRVYDFAEVWYGRHLDLDWRKWTTEEASYIIKGNAAVRRRLAAVPMDDIAISAVTEGELRYGVARLPDNARLKTIVEAFLIRVNVQPLDAAAARCYGALRAGLEAVGAGLANLDTIIAAHALARGSTLITHDKAFARVKGLVLEDWTK